MASPKRDLDSDDVCEDKHNLQDCLLEETIRDMGDVTTEEDAWRLDSLPHFIPDNLYDSDISYYYSEDDFGDSDIGDVGDFDVGCEDEHNQDVLQEDEHSHKDRLLGIYAYFPEGLKIFRSIKQNLTKQDWKLSWPKEGETAESGWVHVYGFYSEEECCGGYGVIVRNMSAKPIAASVHFSLQGVSYIYHVLKGLDAGLKLALRHGCSSPRMVCNSEAVVQLLRSNDMCCRRGCRNLKANNVCQSCALAVVPHMAKGYYFKRMEPALETLQGKLPIFNYENQPKKWNKAAYYLAKQAKRTLLVYGETPSLKADIQPEKFPDELLDILWSDAYDSVFYNLEARNMILSGIA